MTDLFGRLIFCDCQGTYNRSVCKCKAGCAGVENCVESGITSIIPVRFQIAPKYMTRERLSAVEDQFQKIQKYSFLYGLPEIR